MPHPYIRVPARNNLAGEFEPALGDGNCIIGACPDCRRDFVPPVLLPEEQDLPVYICRIFWHGIHRRAPRPYDIRGYPALYEH